MNKLVLLPGWAMPASIFEPWGQQLASQFNIIKIDLFNKRVSKDLFIDSDFKKMLARLVKYLPDSAYYFGWSLGGLIALGLARYYPQRVQAGINLAVNPCFVAHTDWPGMPLLELTNFIRQSELSTDKILRRFLILMLNGDSHTIKSICHKILMSLPVKQTLINALLILKNTDFRSELSNIKAPQKYIYMQDDAIVPIAVASAMQKLVDKKSIITIEGHHAPFLSAMNPLTQIITELPCLN